MEHDKAHSESALAELNDMTNHIEDLLEFHPEFLTKLSGEYQEVLRQFFFAGRDIDVESVADYQRDLEQRQPGITARARAAYWRLVELSGKS